ncbi:MAG: hypothetical protein K6E94_00550 [Elusimicrobiaceae bacterium]|nr:hypothetical protein [Elusimicrobiaceae bacterium]
MAQCDIVKEKRLGENYLVRYDHETRKFLFKAKTQKMAVHRARLSGYKADEIVINQEG